MANRSTLIAILNTDKCKPNKCNQECRRNCPPVHVGKRCIEVTPTSKSASISEELCTGCGICVHKWPFKAIQIINLPKALDEETTHRYGPNHFKLHRLPVPRPGEVLGLVGTNGIGKSTALKILSGGWKSNLGRFNAVIKPQYVDHIPKVIEGSVREILKQKDERGIMEKLCIDLELHMVLDRNVGEISGGELQRFAIAVSAMQNADIYIYICSTNHQVILT